MRIRSGNFYSTKNHNWLAASPMRRFSSAHYQKLPSKTTDFSHWYTQVLLRSELLDYSDVSGCHILRPWGLALWSHLQSWLAPRFIQRGVQDAYFPLLIPEAALAREASHVKGFAPEVAWVTQTGNETLSKRLAIRPTSETAMYPAFSRWIKSYRDLPLRLNQWCNVVRWEAHNPMPLIRSREFLWQEGHSAFARADEALQETREMLALYAAAYRDHFAIPVICGRKSTSEQFAGAQSTLSLEVFLPAAKRTIQAATAHYLGQRFSRMFDIRFEDTQHKLEHAWQTSWGFTTRSLGIAVMAHGDDKGLILPPNAAPVQIVIIPVGIKNDADSTSVAQIHAECQRLEHILTTAGMRAKADLDTNTSPGWKFNSWELKGVPLRIEVGPKELETKQLTLNARHQSSQRQTIGSANCVSTVRSLLDSIQSDLLAIATATTIISPVDTWEDFEKALERKSPALVPWCEASDCEATIKQRTSTCSDGSIQTPAKSLCIPFEQPTNISNGETHCVACNRQAKSWTLFGQSY